MAQTLTTTCVIAGGGPAGMMCGYLLARAGIDVIVLEKHKDFLRDFRGDTVHPSTLEVMDELGLLDEFLKLPHQQITQAQAKIGGRYYHVADLSHLPMHCKFVALMPQWDFLNFLAEQGQSAAAFQVMMEAEATGPDARRRPRHRRQRQRRRTATCRSTPISSSAPTAAIPPCAMRRACA